MRYFLFFCLVLVFAASFVESAGAALYKYVDELGVSHYTNVPSDKRYKPVILHSEPRPPKQQAATRQLYSCSLRSVKSIRGQGGSSASFAFDPHIQRAARAHRIDPMLIKAMIKTESNFNPDAVSAQGAQGLMQLMPGTSRELRVKDPFDAWQNVYAGARYFRKLLDTYNGNIRLSLAAYNAGPGRVKTSMPRIPETVAYVSKVMRIYRAYRNSVGPSATTINVRKLVVN